MSSNVGFKRRLVFRVLLFACGLPACAAVDCQSLGALHLQSTTVSLAQTVPAGDFAPPGGADPLRSLPAFCRVVGVIKAVSDSSVQFEVWMPAEKWNGKFRGA